MLSLTIEIYFISFRISLISFFIKPEITNCITRPVCVVHPNITHQEEADKKAAVVLKSSIYMRFPSSADITFRSFCFLMIFIFQGRFPMIQGSDNTISQHFMLEKFGTVNLNDHSSGYTCREKFQDKL